MTNAVVATATIEGNTVAAIFNLRDHDKMNKIRLSSPLHAAVGIFALLLTACGSGGGNPLPGGGGGVGGGTVTSITVTPAATTMTADRVLQLVATDNLGNDVTASVTWGVAGIGAINATGLLDPEGATGTATVTATYNPGALTGNATITVNAAATTFSIGTVTDPLAAQQWHLLNTGQTGYADTAGTAGADINVDPVYSGYGIDGTGVIVAVVDSGLEIAHEDLTGNVVANGSWDFNENDTDPTNPTTDGDHGTSVAGLIAGTRNAVGGIGVASGASLKGFNFLDSNQFTSQWVDSLGGSSASPNSSDVWVFNQSYGSSTDRPRSTSRTVVNQFIYGVNNLRNGRGALYVKAAGNGFDLVFLGYDVFGNPVFADCTQAIATGISCENANFDPYNTLPYNIVVSALNADSVKTSYSTTGSAVWVSAPGGEFGGNVAAIGAGEPAETYEPAMVTTDQSTCAAGYAQTADVTYVSSTFDGNLGGVGTAHADNTNCNYTNGMNGTSSATPVTAGVIALILEANPALTWRDVKHILATTSTQVDAAKADVSVNLTTGGAYVTEPQWTQNTAGYWYHNWYGFGRVNATAAVAAAQSYNYGSLGEFTDTGWISSGVISVTIPNDSTVGASHSLAVSNDLVVEAVQIMLSASHPYTGDLGIELTSPNGTRSVLKNVRDGFATANFSNFQLMSNAFYGEPSTGTWTLKVVDGNNGVSSSNGTLVSWNIRIYGHAP
jgi:subtilisin family serine protease